MLTQKLVQEKLNYDELTGILTRKGISSRKVGTIDNHGYIRLFVNNKRYRAHRVIFLYVNGFLPEYIDHIDGDRLNNKIENLRACTISNNQQNKKINSNNKSGIKGVSWHKATNKWRASLTFDGMCRHIGVFKRIEDAENAVRECRIKNHGEFCNHGSK